MLAVPVLVLGEFLVRRVGFFSRYQLPAPVIGGLLISILVLVLSSVGFPLVFQGEVNQGWWTWLVLPEPRWAQRPSLDVFRPFMVGFFATIGLNASWQLLRLAGRQLPLFLVIAGVVAMLQNALGLSLATAFGQPPLLGLICGSVSMTGGHGTAIGFADLFEKAGFHSARLVGMAAATFGLVSGGLIGGPLGGSIIRKFKLKPDANGHSAEVQHEHGDDQPAGIIGQIRALGNPRASFVAHLILLFVCIKVGAWVSLGLEALGLTVPVYVGAIIVGIALRNGLEALGATWLNSTTIGLLSSVCLGVFLTTAMMTLQLTELAATALPMLLILMAQVVMMLLYARYITFQLMGRDYDAAVMAAGHCGFGLGATPTAMANMKAISDRFGYAPRAYLVVPVVGAFFIDLINTLVITAYLNFLESFNLYNP